MSCPYALPKRIAQFPAESIHACKQAVCEPIQKPIQEALKSEPYWLYQATGKTHAIKRFAIADEKRMEHDMKNYRNWNHLVMPVQDTNEPPLDTDTEHPKEANHESNDH